MSKFKPGKVQIILDEQERKWLLGWLKSIVETEKDEVQCQEHLDPETAKQYLFNAQKLHHVVKTGSLHGSKFARANQKQECRHCGREFTYLHRHSCPERQKKKSTKTKIVARKIKEPKAGLVGTFK